MDTNTKNTLLTGITQQRKDVVKDLVKRDWFKNTDSNLQKELLNLPTDFDPFLRSLGKRKEEIGEVTVLKLKKLLVGNYIAVPVFEVRSNLTNQVFTYEYASWKFGKFSGYKGIILIEIGGKLEYLLIRKGEKFTIANSTHDTIGTFLAANNNEGSILPKKIEKQVKQLLGVEELPIKRFVDLGTVYPDIGMSNNQTGLYAMIIDGSQSEKFKNLVKERSTAELSSHPVGFELELIHLNKLSGFIAECDDSFFLACIARLVATKLIAIT